MVRFVSATLNARVPVIKGKPSARDTEAYHQDYLTLKPDEPKV